MPASKCEHCGKFASELTDTDDGEMCKVCLDKFYQQCENCDKYILEKEIADCGGTSYCSNCASDNGYNKCEDCGDWSEDLLACGRYSFCPDCAKNHGYHNCHNCGELLNECDLYTSDHDNYWYCESCYHNLYTECEHCAREIYIDDAICTDNGYYCSNCHSDINEWEPRRNTPRTGRYDKVGSERCFGVEIETSECEDSNDFSNHRAWGCKEDGSISGMEFYSSILCGNEGFEAIDDICKYAKNNHWRVNDDCGLHIHLDMRNETEYSLYNISAAFCLLQEVFQGLVDQARVENNYCHGLKWGIDELICFKNNNNFSGFTGVYYRYQWFNIYAYNHHKTFEIRLHHATLNATEIKNWIRAFATLFDWFSGKSLKGILDIFQNLTTAEKFAKVCEIWESKNCSDLVEYYSEKARGYGAFDPMELETA